MVEPIVTEALHRFDASAIVAQAGVMHVLTALEQDLAEVCGNKGILALARRRDDWVSKSPRDRAFVAGSAYAVETFGFFRRSVEALCRFDMAGGEVAITLELAGRLHKTVQQHRTEVQTGGTAWATMIEHADGLRLQERDIALGLIHRQLGFADDETQSGLPDDAAAEQAGTMPCSAEGEPGADKAPMVATKLTDLLLDPNGDAADIEAAVDLLVHNLRTVARLHASDMLPAGLEACVDDMLARAGSRLTEVQLHRLGDALQRLNLKAWGTCLKLLHIRDVVYNAGKLALRDGMAGIAGVRARQSAVRAQAQQIWQGIGLVDAEVGRGAGPSGASPRDGAAPR